MSSVTTSGATRSTFSFARIWDQFGMLVVFAVLFIGCVIFVPNFASFVNMKGLGLAISMSGMVACGMLFCLASGDFDLSVASVIACAGVTTAVVINLSESLWLGIAAGLLLGALSGLVNGFVIARLKINALITTLATMQIVRGLAYIISDGKAVGIEDERFFTLGYANWFGLPAPIWLTVACLVVFGLLLNKPPLAVIRWLLAAMKRRRAWPASRWCAPRLLSLCSPVWYLPQRGSFWRRA